MSTSTPPHVTTARMLLIKALDNSAALELSEVTGKWYVHARIEISDGGILKGVAGEHCDAPAMAVASYLAALQEVAEPEVLVTKASDWDARRHWRWNGATWREIPKWDRVAT